MSNDTNVPPPESSCYTDPGNVTLPTIVEEDCERTAQYIWIYQFNKSGHAGDVCPILEICEVQVFGMLDSKSLKKTILNVYVFSKMLLNIGSFQRKDKI